MGPIPDEEKKQEVLVNNLYLRYQNMEDRDSAYEFLVRKRAQDAEEEAQVKKAAEESALAEKEAKAQARLAEKEAERQAKHQTAVKADIVKCLDESHNVHLPNSRQKAIALRAVV